MKRHIIVLALLATLGLSALAQNKVSFQTSELQNVATTMKLEKLDTLPTGVSYIADGENKIVVRKNDNGVVEHIGLRVFPIAYRTAEYTMVCDFIENALLYNTYKISENKLKFSDAKFLIGNWNNLLNMPDSIGFSIKVIDNKAYQLTWIRSTGNDAKNIVDMLLPIKYDVLSNASRKELEHNFVRDIRTYKAKDIHHNIDVAALRMVVDGGDTLYVAGSKHYLQDNITNSTFYTLIDDSLYLPVLSEKYPIQSMANLALLGQAGKCTARIKLTVIGTDNYRDSLEVNMINLIDYATRQGCVPYFGFESDEKGILKAALFLYNKELGYDHVLSLECNKGQLNTEQLLFTSRAYLFTPTTNVKNLYREMNKK